MKLLIILFSVFVLFIFIEPAVEGVRNAGNLLGALSGTVSLVLGLHFNSFEIKTRGVVILLLSVFYLALFFAMYWVYVGGKSENGEYETVLVLGCRVKGSIPSKALEKRVDKAFTCLNQNPDAVAVLSGGQGRDEFLSEAQCMKNMLVQRGISEKRLVLETRSTSTDENIRYSTVLMREGGLSNKTALVTSEYHQKRAKLICKRYGLEPVAKSSRTKGIFLPTFLLREILALVNEKLKV
ncbi:MAG: YdcF family protein [Eubacterium sp.]|nr:YdcF family protein [Eubacterium sp.]